MRPRVRTAIAALLVSACGGDAQPPDPAEVERPSRSGAAVSESDTPARVPGTPTTSAADLVDSSIPPAIAGEDGWDYNQHAAADLDGDGREERVVLTARVEMYRGRPAWDDGQPWQVYVEAADGTRTYAYARRLQLGTLTMRLTRGGDYLEPTIVLLEHLPDHLRVLEISYAGPGRLLAVPRFQRDLDPRGEVAGPELS